MVQFRGRGERGSKRERGETSSPGAAEDIGKEIALRSSKGGRNISVTGQERTFGLGRNNWNYGQSASFGGPINQGWKHEHPGCSCHWPDTRNSELLAPLRPITACLTKCLETIGLEKVSETFFGREIGETRFSPHFDFVISTLFHGCNPRSISNEATPHSSDHSPI